MDENGFNGPAIDGNENAYEAAFIIGQEPDSMRGDYAESQGFSGDITELNIWNMVIEENQIIKMARCESSGEGNSVRWNKNWLKINLVKITDIDESFLFCQRKSVLVIFPRKLSLLNAERTCSIYGGEIAVPSSEKENNQVKNVLSQHNKVCVEKKNFASSDKGKGVWLGMQKNQYLWYKMQPNKSLVSINYSNWDEVYGQSSLKINQELCPFMFSDGLWGYDRMNRCRALTLCVICSFPEIPVFALKGQCRESTSLEWNYYMVLNSLCQAESFEGYTKRSKIIFDGEKWKKENMTIKGVLELKKATHPLGRYNWDWYDQSCGVGALQKKSFAFSVCKFGEEYTCDSGECVAISKRCDTIHDCEDSSDEDECDYILIPSTYRKIIAPQVKRDGNDEIRILTMVIVENIDYIDTLNMRIGLTLTLKMKWADNRLTYKNLHRGMHVLSETTGANLWLPLDYTTHEHAIVGRIVKDSNKRIVLHTLEPAIPIDPHNSREDSYFSSGTNTLEMSQRFKIEYNCVFHLQHYPFDKLICEFGIRIESSLDKTFLLLGETNNSVSYVGPTMVEDFEILGVTNYSSQTISGNKDNRSRTFRFFVSVKRNYSAQIVSTFCPTILFWIIAYCTLFMDIDDISNRSRTTVTVLLVLVALLQTVKRDFPKTTYFKYIDFWFLWYTSNIFLITIFHIMLLHCNGMFATKNQICAKPLERMDNENVDNSPNKKLNTIALFFLPILMVLFNMIYFSLTN